MSKDDLLRLTHHKTQSSAGVVVIEPHISGLISSLIVYLTLDQPLRLFETVLELLEIQVVKRCSDLET